MIQQSLFRRIPAPEAPGVPLDAFVGLTPTQRKRVKKGLHPLGQKLIPSGRRNCGGCGLFELKRFVAFKHRSNPEGWGYCKRTKTPANVKDQMTACEKWIPEDLTQQDLAEIQEAVLDAAPLNEAFGMTPEVWR